MLSKSGDSDPDGFAAVPVAIVEVVVTVAVAGVAVKKEVVAVIAVVTVHCEGRFAGCTLVTDALDGA
jgi:hypothetical protein